MIESLQIFAAFAASLTALVLILRPEKILGIWLLAVQYLAVFFLISSEWSLIPSLIFLFAGWMSGVVLGMAVLNATDDRFEKLHLTEPTSQLSPLLKLFAAAIIFLVVLSFVFRISSWIPDLDIYQCWTALLLVGFGLLRLTLNPPPIASAVSLLTMLSGFEILFSGLTSSLLATGMLAGVTLFISLSGAYLELAPQMEEQR